MTCMYALSFPKEHKLPRQSQLSSDLPKVTQRGWKDTERSPLEATGTRTQPHQRPESKISRFALEEEEEEEEEEALCR
ncbi:unnamed protein product [Caretta caretta]